MKKQELINLLEEKQTLTVSYQNPKDAFEALNNLWTYKISARMYDKFSPNETELILMKRDFLNMFETIDLNLKDVMKNYSSWVLS